MKVCHITSVHPRYDIRIFVKECKALSRDHNVTLIVADSLGNEIKDNINIIDVGKVNCNRLIRMYLTSNAIFNKVIALKPDIVHFHDPELMSVAYSLSKRGFKVIYDVHEDVPKQVMNKHWIPVLLRPIVSKLIKYKEFKSARSYAGIICATEIIANRFKKYNKNTVAIHNYPLLSEFNQREVSWSERNLELCYLGSISETRGIVPLVNSLAISELNLELAGIYSNDIVRFKVKTTEGHKLVNYHGVLNRNEVADLLTKVRVGVVTLLPTPSSIESLPIKLLEYMLAGIPVVASNFTLWQQYVKEYNCGIMVNPESPNEIADACRYLLDNPKEAEQMGINGRQAVLNNYTWETESNKLLNFYSMI
ncbi:MAG: glycosyltransferase family 4 protein [Burkholderiales bacterium]|nr:glycosyltransferase family 4 protein [Burkholderiales bacterium]